jgi:phenylacetate-CoA ligase
MTNSNIDRLTGLYMQDLYSGTQIVRTLKFLRKSQFWDEEKLIDYQFNKFHKLVEYAYTHVPYYEELFKKISLKPSDIKSISDIEKIPVLTKELFRQNNDKLISKKHNLLRIKKGKTGGTTGAPVYVYKDTFNRSFTWASYYRWYDWMDIKIGDPVATLWGSRTVLSPGYKRQIIDSVNGFLSNSIRINSFGLDRNGFNDAYKRLINFEPQLLKGYLSALLDLASYIDTNDLDIIKPKAISSTTETLLPNHRIFLQRVFDAPIFDQYGCGEVSAISYECEKHEGLHVTLEHVICEILDDNDKNIVNHRGRVVATDLDNYVMPIIRYETGDVSSITSSKCSCGRVHPIMQGIDGRTTDTLQLKTGARVHGVFITDILAELNLFTDKIEKFQIVQSIDGQITFIYKPGKYPLNQSELNKLQSNLEKYFNEVRLDNKKEFTYSKSGKFRYLISDLTDVNTIF